jgi:cell division protein FtsL
MIDPDEISLINKLIYCVYIAAIAVVAIDLYLWRP